MVLPLALPLSPREVRLSFRLALRYKTIRVRVNCRTVTVDMSTNG